MVFCALVMRVIALVATPIGNLQDMTPRALDALRAADVIACEDTRRTRPMLTHFGITNKELVSFHRHNWRASGPELVRRAQAGENIALVSDAGMPGISDPGAELVRLAVDAGAALSVLPGASAALCALVLSGLPCERFAFEGFLPRQRGEALAHIKRLKAEERTLVFYEAPHDIVRTLGDLYAAFSERPAAVARELTKLHEEVLRGTLSSLIAHFAQTPPRGELVLVVGGAPAQEAAPVSARAVEDAMRAEMDGGMRRKDAARAVAERLGVPVNAAYQAGLEK